MKIEAFFDKQTFTMTYVVYDSVTKDGVVIDPVQDFDSASGKLSQEKHSKILNFINKEDLRIHYSLETHVHADHLSGSVLLKKDIPGLQTAISENIKSVQEVFKPIYNLTDLVCDGSQFDLLLKEGEVLKAGSLKIKVIQTPGHTPACVSYLIGDALFTGDAIFMPDMGTGRCDFPKGDSENLYNSIQKLYALDDKTRVFVGHDYAPGGREYAWETTIGEQKKENIQLKSSTSKEEFVSFRTKRDEQLSAPKLLLPSIQVNMNGGQLPAKEDNGVSYLRIPLGQSV